MTTKKCGGKGKIALMGLLSAMLLSSCSFSGGEIKISTHIQSDSSLSGRQPTAETEIILGGESGSEATDGSISTSAGFFLGGADSKLTDCYKEIYSGVMSYQEEIKITEGVLSQDSIGDFMSLIICTAPDISQLSGEYTLIIDGDGYVKKLNITYKNTKEEGDALLAQVKAEVDSIVSQTEGMSDYEKVKYFHDRIITKCSYSEEGSDPYSAYGCLIEGKAVCEGYSKAMLMLCETAGIDCIPVMGESLDGGESVPHMWNKVKLNGEWYNVDVTWDDPICNLGDDYVRYDYLNVSDEALKADHVFEETEYMKYPDSLSDSENYFVKSGLLIDSTTDIQGLITQIMVQQAENNDRYVRVKCSDSTVFEQASQLLFGNGDGDGIIFDLLSQASQQAGGKISATSYSLMKNEYACTITVILN